MIIQMEIVPTDPHSIEPTKNAASIGPIKEFPSVHLGREGSKYYDTTIFDTTKGFSVKASQTSYGGTFLNVAATNTDKYEVESLDKKDGEVSWKKAGNPEDGVPIYRDWGNLDNLGDTNIADLLDKAGNPGIKYGFTKVTDKTTNESRIFAVGANFDGKADDWKVKVAYFEITLNTKAGKLEGNPSKNIASLPRQKYT